MEKIDITICLKKRKKKRPKEYQKNYGEVTKSQYNNCDVILKQFFNCDIVIINKIVF